MTFTGPIVNAKILLYEGASGPEVANLQAFLNSQGARLLCDEHFGPLTASALTKFQQDHELATNGHLDEATRRQAVALGFIPFVQSLRASILIKPRTPDLVVIHTMENSEAPLSRAEEVALWFGGRTAFPVPRASAHYCVDQDSIVQCVRETDVAWHADEANGRGIGVEHAGYAAQSVVDWGDRASTAILERSAGLVAKICARWVIPVVKLSPSAVKAGMRGLCGHVDVNVGYGRVGGHVDPGPNFPWDAYLTMVMKAEA